MDNKKSWPTNIKVAWDCKHLLKPGQTTDVNGFAPMRFSYAEGTVEELNVRAIPQQDPAMSHAFAQFVNGRMEDNYADVWVFHTKDCSQIRIVASAQKQR